MREERIGDCRLILGDVRAVLATLPPQSVQCVVTSPPYWGLRDYKVVGQMGLEPTPQEYVDGMVGVFRLVREALRDDGTLWLNLGDTYCSHPHGPRGENAQDPKWVGARVRDRNTQTGQPNRQKIDGLKHKDLVGIPWRVAFALQADGWYLRSDIIWAKPNPMPESVTDRPTRSHEYLFLLSKSPRYHYDAAAIREALAEVSLSRWAQDIDSQEGSWRANGGEKTNGPMKAVRDPRKDKQRGHSRRHDGFNDRWDQMSKEEQQSLGRNKRDVWTVATKPYPQAHFATFPPELVEPCVKAGCPAGGVVLDPFAGTATVGEVCIQQGCRFIGIELNPDYLELAKERLAAAEAKEATALFASVTAPHPLRG